MKYQVVTFFLYRSNPNPKIKINYLYACEIIDAYSGNCTAMDLEIMFNYLVFQSSFKAFFYSMQADSSSSVASVIESSLQEEVH